MKCKMCGAGMEIVSKDGNDSVLQCKNKCGYEVFNEDNYTFHDYKGMALHDYLWFRKIGVIKDGD